LYKIFQQQDYQPELFSDGYISGYLLIRGDDYRFVVAEGQHRAACLASLGITRLRCRFSQKAVYPRTVKFQDFKNWPQVKNGAFSEIEALRVFERFFARNVGRDRMNLQD